MNSISIKYVTPEVAQRYVDYMVSTKKYSPTTTLNNLNALSSLFNHMVKRGVIDRNPFQNVDKPKKQASKQNLAYTDSEIKSIKEQSLLSNPRLWDAIQVIYYTYLRPIEIGRLRVKHILLDQLKIYVPAEISKNKKDAFLVIPEALAPVFDGIENYPGDFFVFGKDGETSKTAIGENWLRRKHTEILKTTKITGKTLYSWKHTGVVEAYKNGVDIKAIQQQCRHHSIQQTDTYLKSLGFVDNVNFRLGVKEI